MKDIKILKQMSRSLGGIVYTNSNFKIKNLEYITDNYIERDIYGTLIIFLNKEYYNNLNTELYKATNAMRVHSEISYEFKLLEEDLEEDLIGFVYNKSLFKKEQQCIKKLYVNGDNGQYDTVDINYGFVTEIRKQLF